MYYLAMNIGASAAKAELPEIESLPIDTWGVDYVFLKGYQGGQPVYAYRDSRTETVIPLGLLKSWRPTQAQNMKNFTLSAAVRRISSSTG